MDNKKGVSVVEKWRKNKGKGGDGQSTVDWKNEDHTVAGNITAMEAAMI